MRFKELGRTGVKIPEIGLGTWGYHAGPELLRRGLDAGALFIDTAESYGTESIVGEAIAGRRERVFLATKVSPHHFRRADVLRAANDSLLRLQTDYIDLYQLHEPNESIPVEETLGAVEELVEAGKVRFVGVSNFSLSQLQRAQRAMRKHPIVANQIRLNLIDRTSPELLSYCQVNQINVIAYCPLARGIQGIRDCDPRGVLDEVAEANRRTVAQTALNWCLSHDGVVVIPKGNTLGHVLENCGASDWKLSDADFQRLSESIAYRRRGKLDALVRRCLPSGFKQRLKGIGKLLPPILRRRLN